MLSVKPKSYNITNSIMILLRLPGFVTILIAGIVILLYGMTLDMDPNWVMGFGTLLIIISIMAATLVK